MNGIDVVIMVFGNDWCVVEVVSYVYVVRIGSYKLMFKWLKDVDGYLVGELMLLMLVVFVGGFIGIYLIVIFLKKIVWVELVKELVMLVCVVGLM